MREYPDYLPLQVKRDLQDWEWHKEDYLKPPKSIENPEDHLDKLAKHVPGIDREDIDYGQMEYVETMRFLNKTFLEWREKVVEYIYTNSTRGNMETPTDEGRERYLKDTGEHPSPYKGIPEYEYFSTYILPTLTTFCETPDQLRQAGLDCLAILENLMIGEISSTTHTTQRTLLTQFFQTIEKNDNNGWGGSWRSSLGQFSRFYMLGRGWEPKGRRANPLVIKDNHRDEFYKMIMGPENQDLIAAQTRSIGNQTPATTTPPETHRRKQMIEYLYYEANKWLTLAIAKHQGWECDRHYDGGDYTNSTREIEEKFRPVYEALPLHVRPLVFRAFVQYGGHFDGMAFLNATKKVAQHFIDKGKAHLLLPYYMIVQSAPDITLGQSFGDSDRKNRSEGFPVIDPEEALEEMEAFEENCGEFPMESVDLARRIIASDGYMKQRKPSFMLEPEENHSRLETPHSIPGTTKMLQKKGYTEDQIREALALPKNCPWLKSTAEDLFKNYTIIDKKFPGGIETFTAYLKKISASENAMSHLIHTCSRGNLPSKNLQKFLDLGEEVIRRIGEHGDRYFHVFDTKKTAPLIQMAENDWDKFEHMMRDFLDLTLTFPNEENDRKNVFEALLRNHTDPRFHEWRRIIEMFRDRFIEYLETQGTTHPLRRNVRSLSKILKNLDSAVWTVSETSQFENRKTNRDLFLPPDVNLEEQAKVIEHMAFVEGDTHGFTFNNYLRLVGLGMHPRIAARARVKKHVPSSWGREDDPTLKDVRVDTYVDIPALPCPLGKRKFKKIAEVANRTKILVKNLLEQLQGPDHHSATGFLPSPITNKQGLIKSDKGLFELNTDQLNQNLRLIADLEQDPKVTKYIDFSAIKEEAGKALNLLAMRRSMALPNSYIEYEAPMTPEQRRWLEQTNPSTRTAITGITMLGAFGALDLENLGIPAIENPQRYKGQLLIGDSLAPEEMEQEAAYRGFIKENAPIITRNIGIILPHLIQAVEQARTQTPGKMAIGGKIHTPSAMNNSTIEAIRKTFGIESTCFRLIHADDSLLLPPLPSSFELKLLIRLIQMVGGLQGIEDPEIQFATGGRWPENIASLVAATSLLGTRRGRKFKEGAFKTTHDRQTGARILAYDAGVLDKTLPFHQEGAEGRTDRLGCQIYSDADIIQTLGTLATHATHQGTFTPQWKAFQHKMTRMLDQLNLTRHLREADWILDPKNPDDTTLDKHEAMVKRFTDTWWRESDRAGFGAITDVQDIILDAHDSIERQRDRIAAENPDEMERLLAY